MNHSKTPWKLKFKKDCDWTITAKDGYSILAISYDDKWGRPKEDEANAALIAAAPEMLELLEQVTRLIDRDASGGQTYDSFVYASGIQSKIDRLIQKARGQK